MSFVLLRNKVTNTIQKYFDLTKEADDNRILEKDAAIQIQKIWRGYNARNYISYLNEQAIYIQRAYRGYQGRRNFEEQLQQLQHQQKMDFYNSRGKFNIYSILEVIDSYYIYVNIAVLIQKVFRGYLSRKTRENYHKRNAWIN